MIDGMIDNIGAAGARELLKHKWQRMIDSEMEAAAIFFDCHIDRPQTCAKIVNIDYKDFVVKDERGYK